METYAQKSIRHCISMIAPFEVNNDVPEKEYDRKLYEGKREFRQWILELYENMYKEPEKYLVFAKPYEAYIEKKKNQPVKRSKEKEHEADSRESLLRNTFQQAIQFYEVLFYHLGTCSIDIDEQQDALLLTLEAFTEVTDRINRIHASKDNPARMELLSKLGLVIDISSNQVRVKHSKYTYAMYGIYFLAKAPESKYKYMNFLRLDYKNAYEKAPSVDDILKTLPTESVKTVNQLEKEMTKLVIKSKIRPLRGIVSDFKWKIEYTFHNKSVCGFYADQDYFMLCIHFNNYQNINRFAKELREDDPELFDWYQKQFPERLCKCPSNRRVLLGDEYRRICGLSNRTETVNPSSHDISMAMQILKKRIQRM